MAADWVVSIFTDVGLITLKGQARLWESSVYYFDRKMTHKEAETNKDGNWQTRRLAKVLLKLPGVTFVLFSGNRVSITISKKTKVKQATNIGQIALKTIAEINL